MDRYSLRGIGRFTRVRRVFTAVRGKKIPKTDFPLGLREMLQLITAAFFWAGRGLRKQAEHAVRKF